MSLRKAFKDVFNAVCKLKPIQDFKQAYINYIIYPSYKIVEPAILLVVDLKRVSEKEVSGNGNKSR